VVRARIALLQGASGANRKDENVRDIANSFPFEFASLFPENPIEAAPLSLSTTGGQTEARRARLAFCVAWRPHRSCMSLDGVALLGLCAIALSNWAASYCFAVPLVLYLGPTGVNVLVRVSAFILFCIGIQIGWDGVSALLAGLHSLSAES
jgi:small neutral amino acid transporter SnatA (MarC family)